VSKSILIAASPFVLKDGRVGSVLAHVAHMVRHGGVFWILIQPGMYEPEEFLHPDIESAYFYDVPTKTVLYRAKVEFAGTRTEFPSGKRYDQYFPDFRSKGEGPVYCLLFTSVSHLDRTYRLKDFRKLNGKRVKRVQNYVLIEDPEYPEIFTIK
jgi:hypothetical protein